MHRQVAAEVTVTTVSRSGHVQVAESCQPKTHVMTHLGAGQLVRQYAGHTELLAQDSHASWLGGGVASAGREELLASWKRRW